MVRARGPREAETVKLLETNFRHVNIALVNEMAVLCHDLGVDLWDVIRCAETKPFGFQAFRPGPGVGGHGVPLDPSYLPHTGRTPGHPLRMVGLAQEVNTRMPQYVIQRCRHPAQRARQVRPRRPRAAARRHLQARPRRPGGLPGPRDRHAG